MDYLAHRGLNRQALENTLPAIELAIDAADGVEIDVQLAGCGTPVVFHDDDLRRLFCVEGTVSDYTADELVELRAVEGPDGPRSHDERIPTLDEVLDLVPDDFFLNVEIKAPNVRVRTPTAAVARRLADERRNVLVSCFNPLELARFAVRAPKIPVALLFDSDSNFVLREGLFAPVLGLTSLRAIHPNWKLVSRDMIERAHARAWKVNVWTVNDPERVAWLEREGVDAVISDVADELRALRR